MKTVLLVIDMQNDFIDEGVELEVPTIRKNLGKVKAFIEKIRTKGIAIIYTRHIYDQEHNPVEAKLFPGLDRLKEGTHGSMIHDILAPKEEDTIIAKRRYDAFIGTDLEVLLRCRKVENIIITGTMTNVCCESTARTAMMKDFNVFFCRDLTFTNDEKIHDYTLKNIASHFGKVMHSEEICRFF